MGTSSFLGSLCSVSRTRTSSHVSAPLLAHWSSDARAKHKHPCFHLYGYSKKKNSKNSFSSLSATQLLFSLSVSSDEMTSIHVVISGRNSGSLLLNFDNVLRSLMDHVFVVQPEVYTLHTKTPVCIFASSCLSFDSTCLLLVSFSSSSRMSNDDVI